MSPVDPVDFNQDVIARFRANAGRVGPPFDDRDLLLLTSTGARSGLPRVSPLTYRRIDGRLLVIAGNGGTDVTPSWVHNLRADPHAHVEVGTAAFDVLARELTEAERTAVLPEIIAAAPYFADWAAGVSRVIPIFELVGE